MVEYQDLLSGLLSTFWSVISSAGHWTTETKLAKEQTGKQMSMANILLRTCLYKQKYIYLLVGHLRIQQQRILLRRKIRFIWDYEKSLHYHKSMRTLYTPFLDLG